MVIVHTSDLCFRLLRGVTLGDDGRNDEGGNSDTELERP
jgi:hypothetical protein